VRNAGVAAASAVLFGVAFFLRMDSAYGPLNLTLDPRDWTVLWELFRYGQIATAVVVESAVLAVAAAVAPWILVALLARVRQRRDRRS
jgi:hypothetical protein